MFFDPEYSKFLKSPEWQVIREVVFARYGKRCVCCGVTSPVQVHHLSYDNWKDVRRMRPLCTKCHQEVTILDRRYRKDRGMINLIRHVKQHRAKRQKPKSRRR